LTKIRFYCIRDFVFYSRREFMIHQIITSIPVVVVVVVVQAGTAARTF